MARLRWLTPFVPDPRERRYFLLDGMRGLAAVAVLFWHYQHFFRPPGITQRFGYEGLEPLHKLFAPLYDKGHDAVPLFWIISGFVFAAVYGERPATTRSFVVNRLARLYPLHLLTLLLVAALQWGARARFGTFLIYDGNTWSRFVAQLAFASAWLTGDAEQSFNGPIWSVSVEVLIYALFWLARPRLFARGIAGPLALFVLFALVMGWSRHAVIWCGELFFLGCATYVAHRLLAGRPLAAAAMCLALAGGAGLLLWRGLAVPMLAVPAVCAAVVLAVATLDVSALPRPRRLLAFVGDSTYGLYLWHIPFQMALFLVVGDAVRIAALAQRPWFLLLFVGGALVLARASYLLFERPMRERVRRLAPGAARPVIAAP